MYWETTVELVMGIPSLLLSSLLVVVVFRLRRQLAVFASLILVHTAINVSSYLNMMVANRLRWEPAFGGLYEWLIGPGSSVRTFVFSYYTASWEMHYAISFLMVLNRFTAIVLHQHHQKIWRFHWLLIFLAVGLVVFVEVFKLNTTSTYMAVPAGDFIAYRQVHPVSSGANGTFLFMAIFSAAYGIPSIALIIFTLHKIFRSPSIIKNKREVERNMLLISVINVFIMVVNMVHAALFIIWVMWAPSNTALGTYIDKGFPFANDLFCLALPWYTLGIRGTVRREALTLLGIRKKAVKSPSISPSSRHVHHTAI